METTVRWLMSQLQKFGLEFLNRYYSVYRGEIVDNDDPDKMGRVILKVPQLWGNEPHKYWAWPLGMVEGVVNIPRIGTKVWVMFEGGDSTVPVWMNGYYTRDKLPTRAVAHYPDVRVTKSPGGNIITLDDNDQRAEFGRDGGTMIGVEDGRINLGTVTGAKEPGVLGDTTAARLKSMCERMEEICDLMAQITVLDPLGVTSVPINTPQILAKKAQITALRATISDIKSTVVRTD